MRWIFFMLALPNTILLFNRSSYDGRNLESLGSKGEIVTLNFSIILQFLDAVKIIFIILKIVMVIKLDGEAVIREEIIKFFKSNWIIEEVDDNEDINVCPPMSLYW